MQRRVEKRVGYIILVEKKKISIKNFLFKLIKFSKTNPILKQDKKLTRPKDINMQIANPRLFVQDTSWREKYNLTESINFFFKEIEKVFFYNNK